MKIKKESKNKKPVKATNSHWHKPCSIILYRNYDYSPQTESKKKEKNCEKHTKQNIYPLLSRFVTTPLYL